MAHQYARTAPGARAGRANTEKRASLPILRHQDHDLYYREHGDRLGIGYYGHRPMPVDVDSPLSARRRPMPSMLAFTEDDFAPAWAATPAAAAGARRDQGGGGLQRHLLLHPRRHAADGRVTRRRAGSGSPRRCGSRTPPGVATGHGRVARRRRTPARPARVRPQPLREAQLAPAYVHARAHARTSSRSTTSCTRSSPTQNPARLRVSPFHARQQELGAVFLEAGGWERPHWFEANAPLMTQLPPTAAAAATTGRPGSGRRSPPPRRWPPANGVALYDMTPLKRARGQRARCAGLPAAPDHQQLAKSVGSVTYTLLLDDDGGIRSDLTVARLGRDVFQVGANGNLDLDWLRRHARRRRQVRDITGGTCCLGVWGPLARDLVQPLTGRLLAPGLQLLPGRQARIVGRCRSPRCGCPMWANSAGRSTPAPTTACGCGTRCGRPGSRRRHRGRAGRVQQPAPGEGLPARGAPT